MATRAKFYVYSITKQRVGNGEVGATIELMPVVDGSNENKEFFKWTPGGSIKLSTVNEEAAKEFDVGKEFYINFTPAA